MGWTAIQGALARLEGLSATQRLVYLGLAYHANTEGRAWPSLRKLAEYAGCERRAVQYALRTLEQRNLVERVDIRKTNGATGSAAYKLIFEGGRVHVHARGGAPGCTGGCTPMHPLIEEEQTLNGQENPKKEAQSSTADPDVKLDDLDTGPMTLKKGSTSVQDIDPSTVKTGDGVEKLWKATVHEVYGGFQPPFLVKEKAQGKMLIKRIGPDRIVPVVQHVIKNWTKFVERVKILGMAKTGPAKPHIGYLLVHCQTAVEFTEVKETIPAPQVKGFISAPVESSGPEAQDVLLTPEEVAKLFEDK